MLNPQPGVAAALKDPYLGPAWGRKAVEALRRDPRVKAAVQGTEVSVMTLIRDAPPDRYEWLYAAFDGTGLADARMGRADDRKAGLPDATFTIEGPYSA